MSKVESNKKLGFDRIATIHRSADCGGATGPTGIARIDLSIGGSEDGFAAGLYRAYGKIRVYNKVPSGHLHEPKPKKDKVSAVSATPRDALRHWRREALQRGWASRIVEEAHSSMLDAIRRWEGRKQNQPLLVKFTDPATPISVKATTKVDLKIGTTEFSFLIKTTHHKSGWPIVADEPSVVNYPTDVKIKPDDHLCIVDSDGKIVAEIRPVDDHKWGQATASFNLIQGANPPNYKSPRLSLAYDKAFATRSDLARRITKALNDLHKRMMYYL